MDILEIRDALNHNVSIEYTMHCQKRMLERGILRQDIIKCIQKGEIIEDYPLSIDNDSNKSFPSCLILGIREEDKKAIHIVVGFNGNKILIISACYPDKDHWLEDNKTRR